MHGLAVTIIEGIGSTITKLHAVQAFNARVNRAVECTFSSSNFVGVYFIVVYYLAVE